MNIERVVSPTPEVIELIAALESELSANHPPEQNHGLPLHSLFQPHVHFVVAQRDGRAIGCGGIALFSGFAELKRFYVKPNLRGQGIADALLHRLVDVATAAGHTVLRLETGTEQQAALRFYQRSGFARCTAFEPYALMPETAIATSVFMEKILT